MSRPNGCPEDDDGRGELARMVRSVKKPKAELPVIDKFRHVVEQKQANRINGVYVDLFSASVVVQIHDALNAANREKLCSLGAYRMTIVAFKLAKKCRS